MKNAYMKPMFALIALLFAATAVQAQDAAIKKAFDRLNVTQEQRDQVKQAYRDLQTQVATIQADLKIRRAELEKVLIGKNPSRAEYTKILQSIAELETGIRAARIDVEIKVRGIIGDVNWTEMRRIIRKIQPAKAPEKVIKDKGNGTRRPTKS